mgnify:CR=1 FL=1
MLNRWKILDYFHYGAIIPLFLILKINTNISIVYIRQLILFISIYLCSMDFLYAQINLGGMNREATIYSLYNIKVDETSLDQIKNSSGNYFLSTRI